MPWFKNKRASAQDHAEDASVSKRSVTSSASKTDESIRVGAYVAPSSNSKKSSLPSGGRPPRPHPSGDALRLPTEGGQKKHNIPYGEDDENYDETNPQETGEIGAVFQRMRSAKGDEESEDSREGTKNTEEYKVEHSAHLNSLFNGHLMKWKFDAEEGTAFIRIPAFFAGLSLIGTTTYALVMYRNYIDVNHCVISGFVYLIALTICILDGRFMMSSPLSVRAHMRNVVTRHFNIFRFLWGRGVLYIIGGILSCSLLVNETMVSGAIVFIIGVMAVTVGIYSSHKFSTLRNSLADESFLLLQFAHFDFDDDGYLAPPEFANLLAELGMELDDRYALKAFNGIDSDHDRKISFEQFCSWWSQGYVERGRKLGGDDDDCYTRFD